MKTRRDFLAMASLCAVSACAAQSARKRPRVAAPLPTVAGAPIKPRALKPGDVVGLVAPASYTFDLWRLDDAAARVRALGLEPRFGKHVRARRGFLAGTEEERVEDLHAMFADRSVAGIFCIQGGYGTPRLLDRLDYGLIRRNPKILVGYSDITGLHLAIGRKAGLVTFHGPNALGNWTERSVELLKKALFVAEPLGPLTNPDEKDPLNPEFRLRTVAPGTSRGRLVGGNLTLISATMGTPYEIDTRGRILLLEDIGEAPYRVDRMLVQLQLAGKLREAAGIVFGTCTDCGPDKSSFELSLSLSEVIDELLGSLGKPVLAGLLFGHTREKATIPFGVEAELDAEAKTLTVVEAATTPA